MAPRPVLSPEERELVLREARSAAEGTPIPIRTSRLGGGERSGVAPPGELPPRRDDGARRPPSKPGPLTNPPRRRRRFLWIALAVILLLVVGASAKVLSVGSAVLSPERSVVAQLADLLFRRGKLRGEAENRVNVLLVAIGGEGHQGENLADTVILASFRPTEQDVSLLSIPRDLYVNIPDTELWTRLNAVHAYGENQKKGQGLVLLRRRIAESTGQDLHYVARVDFKAFKRVVDELGGLDITIPNTFYDYWHRINFPAGTEHMNGDRALAYVRARYIEGPEGGDFKRAARTQQVLLAIRKKVLSAQTAVDLRALAGILDALKENVATNFTLGELKRFADLTRGIPDDNMHTAVLTTGADGLLIGQTEILGGRPASILRPRRGLDDYTEVREFVADIFARAKVAPSPAAAAVPLPPAELAASPPPVQDLTAAVQAEQPTADVRNGTNVTGLAAKAAKRLEKQQFTISGVGNAAIRNRTETIVVDRSGGKKPASLKVLLDLLGVSTAVQFPEAEPQTTDATFVVFLGTDVAEKFKK